MRIGLRFSAHKCFIFGDGLDQFPEFFSAISAVVKIFYNSSLSITKSRLPIYLPIYVRYGEIWYKQ